MTIKTKQASPTSYEEFKDARGRWRTVSLFWEFRKPGLTPLFTLAEKGREIDGKYYPSLKEMYLKHEDPKEYSFVTDVLRTSWQHWKRLAANGLIGPHIEEMREELALKLEAKGFQQALELAENGNYQATKLLVDKGWLDKSVAKKKKTKKDKLEAEAEEDALSLVSSFLDKREAVQ